MNKEEILAKSREEYPNKEKETILEYGLKYYEISIILLGVFFVGLNYLLKQPPLFDVCMAVSAFLAASHYPKYRFTKDKKYLLKIIGEGALTLMFFVLHMHFLFNL